MKLTDNTIFIVDDDHEVCEALRWLFESVHFKVETYGSALHFLDQYDRNKSGCIVVDVRMPIMSGLELLEQLNLQKNRLPVIIITGYGDIPMAIRAMKLGAFDFFLKPINDQSLLESVQKSIDKSLNTSKILHISERIKRLSERERQIINLITQGKLNKEIAFELAISMSTVEVHRANIMRKMQAKNLAMLIKLYLQAQFEIEFIE